LSIDVSEVRTSSIIRDEISQKETSKQEGMNREAVVTVDGQRKKVLKKNHRNRRINANTEF
jgi:hypothetical protein